MLDVTNDRTLRGAKWDKPNLSSFCPSRPQLVYSHGRATQSNHGNTQCLRARRGNAANEGINTKREGTRPRGSISASRPPLKCGTNKQALSCTLLSQNTSSSSLRPCCPNLVFLLIVGATGQGLVSAGVQNNNVITQTAIQYLLQWTTHYIHHGLQWRYTTPFVRSRRL